MLIGSAPRSIMILGITMVMIQNTIRAFTLFSKQKRHIIPMDTPAISRGTAQSTFTPKSLTTSAEREPVDIWNIVDVAMKITKVRTPNSAIIRREASSLPV